MQRPEPLFCINREEPHMLATLGNRTATREAEGGFTLIEPSS